MSSLESEANWRTALITLSQFVFLGEREYLKDDLYKNALEITLFLYKDKEPISYRGLQRLLRDDLWDIHLPLTTIEYTCKSLSVDKSVSIKNNVVGLTPTRREEIKKEIMKSQKEKHGIERLLIDQIVDEYRRLTNSALYAKDHDLCIEAFWKYTSKLINSKVNALMKFLSSSDFNWEVFRPADLLKELVDDIEDPHLRKAFRNSFEALFKKKVGRFMSFLYKCSQILTCWRILNIDPLVKILETREFPNKHVFLDTNCVMGLLCIKNFDHISIKELIICLTIL